jgi:AmmeMemoRadiSam system protein B
VDFFQGLKAGSSPKTILLIGPNHYHQGTQPVSLSSLPWKTPFGPLRADRSLIARIKTRLRLPEDPQAFSGEHSLGILVPFLKLYFPDAELVPVLLRVNVPEPLLERFGEVLAEFVRQPRHVVILSMDFSHNSSAERAEAADRAARRVIASLRDDQTRGLQVDCRAGLRVLLRTLRTMGNLQVDFRDHTNSAILTGHRDQAGLTSYFTIFFRECPQSPASLKEKKKGSGFHAFYLFPGVTKPDQ